MFCCLTGSIHVLQRDQDQVPAAGHHHPQVDGLHLHGGPLHQEAPRQVYKNALSLHNATSSLKQLAICARELKKRSAKGSNYKEDDRALPLSGVITLCLTLIIPAKYHFRRRYGTF